MDDFEFEESDKEEEYMPRRINDPQPVDKVSMRVFSLTFLLSTLRVMSMTLITSLVRVQRMRMSHFVQVLEAEDIMSLMRLLT